MTGLAADDIQVFRSHHPVEVKVVFVDVDRHPQHASRIFLHAIAVRCKVKLIGHSHHLCMAEITVHAQRLVIRIHDTVEHLRGDIAGKYPQVFETVGGFIDRGYTGNDE